MTIPTDDEGRFEVADAQGAVYGRGTVTEDGRVQFQHLLNGEPEGGQVVMPATEWERTWNLLPQSRTLTLRAAEGAED